MHATAEQYTAKKIYTVFNLKFIKEAERGEANVAPLASSSSDAAAAAASSASSAATV
jgi:hypothetical protein